MKCGYCGKEHPAENEYCSMACRAKGEAYHRTIEKNEKILIVFLLIGLAGVITGVAFGAFSDLTQGSLWLGIGMVMMGAGVALFPLAKPDLVKKFGVGRALRFSRLFGLFMLILGAVMAAANLIL